MTRQSRVDRAAMTLAIKLMRAESRECAERLDHMLADQGWHETGIFASYHMQTRSLRLRPWMTPPIWIDDIEAALREPRDDQRGNYGAARLLLRMQALGISKYHPTPVEAIEQAEAALRELSKFDNSTSSV